MQQSAVAAGQDRPDNPHLRDASRDDPEIPGTRAEVGAGAFATAARKAMRQFPAEVSLAGRVCWMVLSTYCKTFVPAGELGKCRVRLDTLVLDTGLSLKKGIPYGLKSLRDAGWLASARTGRSSVFYLDPAGGIAAAPAADTNLGLVSDTNPRGVSDTNLKGVTDANPGGVSTVQGIPPVDSLPIPSPPTGGSTMGTAAGRCSCGSRKGALGGAGWCKGCTWRMAEASYRLVDDSRAITIRWPAHVEANHFDINVLMLDWTEAEQDRVRAFIDKMHWPAEVESFTDRAAAKDCRDKQVELWAEHEKVVREAVFSLLWIPQDSWGMPNLPPLDAEPPEGFEPGFRNFPDKWAQAFAVKTPTALVGMLDELRQLKPADWWEPTPAPAAPAPAAPVAPALEPAPAPAPAPPKMVREITDRAREQAAVLGWREVDGDWVDSDGAHEHVAEWLIPARTGMMMFPGLVATEALGRCRCGWLSVNNKWVQREPGGEVDATFQRNDDYRRMWCVKCDDGEVEREDDLLCSACTIKLKEDDECVKKTCEQSL